MKKMMAGVLSACIAFSPVVTPAFGREMNLTIAPRPDNLTIAPNPGNTISQKDEKTMAKELILKVKNKINIPEELTEFNYRVDYSSEKYGKNKYWNFEWTDKKEDKGISIRTDNSGNILSFSKRDRNKEASKPTYLKSELKQNAENFIKQVAPDLVSNIAFETATFQGTYSGKYEYLFVRNENGIKMPDNKIRVSVDYETGEVTGFNCVWTFDVKVPSADTKITIEEAREKIGEKVEMKLEYRNKIVEDGDKKTVKAYLVYVPNDSYMAIDAKTGKIYDTKNEFFDMSEYENKFSNSEDAVAPESMAGGNIQLTDEELKAIEEMNKLIKKDKAIELVMAKKDVLLIPETAKAIRANLRHKYNYELRKEEGYVWDLNFSDPRSIESKEDKYRANVNVTVDAETGKILSFHSRVRDYYDSEKKEWEDVKVKYTSKECQNVFEKFAKEIEEEKFSNTKKSDKAHHGYILKYINEVPVYGGYEYNYVRTNEGIEYDYNNIRGEVDGITGKIYSYNVDWTENIEFESPKKAMSKEDAYKAYSEKDGFELVYEINNKHYIDNNPQKEEQYDYSDLYILEKEVRLVYRTDINPNYISPFTGKQLDYSGDVYEVKDKKEYKDINGLAQERDIKLITDMGYTFLGEEFLPNKEITKDEWIKLMNIVKCYINKDEYKEMKEVSKIDAVKMIIKDMGLEKVAKLPDIYKNPFNNLNETNQEDIGYLALSKGLGIIKGDANNNFETDKNLTRVEAISIALKLAGIK